MRLLQLHEYLRLLDGGAVTRPADRTLCKVCLDQAQSLWPELQLGAWNEHPRRVETVVQCRAGGELLVHINADWKDCFLILVVPTHQSHADTFLLFDIGAEYTEARFSCPEFGVDQIADEELIKRHLHQLNGARDPFAILDVGTGTYLQAYAEGGLYEVEHHLVSLASHYGLVQRVGVEAVTDIFLSYAFGKKEWAREYTWRKMNL